MASARGRDLRHLEEFELSFLTEMVDAIEDLVCRKRGDLPLASFVTPAELKVRR